MVNVLFHWQALVRGCHFQLACSIVLAHVILFLLDLQSEKHRRMLYSMEMEQMAENAKTQMEDVSHIHTDFVTATQIGHVKTMFKVGEFHAHLDMLSSNESSAHLYH